MDSSEGLYSIGQMEVLKAEPVFTCPQKGNK